MNNASPDIPPSPDKIADEQGFPIVLIVSIPVAVGISMVAVGLAIAWRLRCAARMRVPSVGASPPATVRIWCVFDFVTCGLFVRRRSRVMRSTKQLEDSMKKSTATIDSPTVTAQDDSSAESA